MAQTTILDRPKTDPAEPRPIPGGRPSGAEDLRRSRSLLSVTDLSLEEIGAILSLATTLEEEDPLVRSTRLVKRRIALLFYESSTRTRTSFELAAKSLGADTALISSKSSSIEKGESLKDTGITLRALGAECIILRHLSSGAPYLLEEATGLPILNAGDGMHQHPSQALLDLRTILRVFRQSVLGVHEGLLSGITVAITGDVLHSRVARSNALLLPRLGARVILCGPAGLLPDAAGEIGPGVALERDLDKALAQSQVAMMLRIQKERLSGVHIDLEQYVARYQLNGERLAKMAPEAVVMHPGPMIRGLEITSEVADGRRSVIAEQVAHGVPIRMALIHRALVGFRPALHNGSPYGAGDRSSAGSDRVPEPESDDSAARSISGRAAAAKNGTGRTGGAKAGSAAASMTRSTTASPAAGATALAKKKKGKS